MAAWFGMAGLAIGSPDQGMVKGRGQPSRGDMTGRTLRNCLEMVGGFVPTVAA